MISSGIERCLNRESERIPRSLLQGLQSKNLPKSHDLPWQTNGDDSAPVFMYRIVSPNCYPVDTFWYFNSG